MSSSVGLFLGVVFGLLNLVSTDKLVLVQMLMRHGERTPEHIYPSDNNTENTWPQGFGQMTKNGLHDQFVLGQYLRKRYTEDIKFLSPEYQKKELRVRSTDMDRTLMSATNTLQGLYPAESAPWYPVPVHTKEDPEDSLLNMDLPCKKYDDEFATVLKSPEVRNFTNMNKDIINYVCLKAGYSAASLHNIWEVYDPLTIEFAENRSDPRWVTAALVEKVEYFKNKQYEYRHYTDDMKKIKAGVFLNQVYNNTLAKISGDKPSNIKAFMFMAHDIALAAVMYALGIYDNKLPPLSSVLFFELYQTTGNEYVVKISYKNNTVADPMGSPVTMTLPDCPELCPIDKFYHQIKPYLIQDHAAFLAYCEYWGHSNITKGGVVAVSIVCALFLIGLIVLFMWCYRHQQAEVRYSPANFAGDSSRC